MEFLKSFRKFYLPVFLAYVIVSTAVILIADMYREPNSTTFWRNVGWVELLLFVLWLPFLYGARPTAPKGAASRQMAILPAITLVVICYVVLAGATLLYNIFIEDLGNTGTTIQLILGAAGLVIGIGLQMAMTHAEAGVERFSGQSRNELVSPQTLAASIQAAEGKLAANTDFAPLRNAYRSLREDLANRLPAVGAITVNAEYASLCASVWRELGAQPPADAAEARARAGEVEALRGGIGLIVNQLRS